MKFAVRDLGDVPSVGDLALTAAGGPAISPSTIDAFWAATRDAGLSQALVRGALSTAAAYYAVEPSYRVFLRDVLGGLVSIWRSRRLLEELPREPVRIEWMESHAPRGGTVALSHQVTEKKGRGVKLSVAGVGGRTMREVQITRRQDDAPFEGCTTYFLDFLATPRRYSEGDGWELEDMELRGQGSDQNLSCSFCSVDPSDVAGDGYRRGSHRDHTGRVTPLDESEIYVWTKDSHLDLMVPINVHGVEVKVGLELWRSSSVTWSVAWVFAPRYFYQPYRPADTPDLPPMWACRQRMTA
jgi:hypothetical protein